MQCRLWSGCWLIIHRSDLHNVVSDLHQQRSKSTYVVSTVLLRYFASQFPRLHAATTTSWFSVWTHYQVGDVVKACTMRPANFSGRFCAAEPETNITLRTSHYPVAKVETIDHWPIDVGQCQRPQPTRLFCMSRPPYNLLFRPTDYYKRRCYVAEHFTLKYVLKESSVEENSAMPKSPIHIALTLN